MSLERHLETHGPAGETSDLIDVVERLGLRGRGGASFPTAVKMRAAARHRGPRTVLVNAAEGEPLSRKDRVLLAHAPHLVLDGALAAARAIDARQVIVAVRDDAPSAISAIDQAAERRRKSVRIDVRPVPPAYLAGQESALINHLEGRPMRPSRVPPLPVERGIDRRATLVQNPETLAHLALIDRGEVPTTALVTVAGAVAMPGVVEISHDVSVGDVLGCAHPDEWQGVLVGGFHGAWHRPADAATLPLDDRTRAAGVLFALDRRACAPMEIVRAIRWLANESAGQCGPCANGMPAIATLLERSVMRGASAGARRDIDRWSTDVVGRGACHLPDGAMRFLRTALTVFEEEFAHHFRHGRCGRCALPSTLLPMATPIQRAA
jgi:NADH:ubiquinone oxidoreductase subunit F (NADH-binding)